MILPHVGHDGEARIPDGLAHGYIVDVLKARLHIVPPGDHVIRVWHIVIYRRRFVSISKDL